MKSETRNCQNCKNPFVIEPEDFAFYEKIQVPAPTWCPDCRLMRRMCWRNERALYKRPCNVPGHNEDIISVYSRDKNLTVYEDAYWWSDAWDPLDYGRDYDFSKPLFSQFRELIGRVPLIALSVTNMVDCNYCNVCADDKECYLISASYQDERAMFANHIAWVKDCLDVQSGIRSELCYEIVNCRQCYRVRFSRDCKQCSDSSFLYNCVNCHDCFGCTNLRNKAYYFFNKPLSKGDYLKELSAWDTGSFEAVSRLKKEFEQHVLKAPHRFATVLNSVNTTGDNVEHAKNCLFCFDLAEKPSAEDCKFLSWGGMDTKDSYDAGPGVGAHVEQAYEAFDSGIQGSRFYFTSVVYGSYDVRYSINCHGSHDLFACYGLRNKQYCILNKQYTKEEYEKLVPRIREHMHKMPYVDAKGRIYRYGEFFPPELSPFAYNETIAQEYFPLTKTQALAQGYRWCDPETRHIEISTYPADLPDRIQDVTDSILSATIGCAHKGTCADQCTAAFRIIPQELAFYRRMNLPLPRLCPNCRHAERLKLRNPLKLWHRTCMCAGEGAKSNGQEHSNAATHFHGRGPCPNEFETPYAPDRPEIVYCESCYNAEVV